MQDSGQITRAFTLIKTGLIPITPKGFSKIAKKNVSAFHSTSPKYLAKFVNGQRQTDFVISAFTQWNDSSIMDPFVGVATDGGIVFEIKGDMLFSTVQDSWSRKAVGCRWITASQISRMFSLGDSFQKTLEEIRFAILDSVINEFKNEIQTTLKYAGAISVWDKYAEQVNEYEGRFSNTRFDLLDVIGVDSKKEPVFIDLQEKMVEDYIVQYEDFVSDSHLLWKTFVDGNTDAAVFSYDELFIVNYTIEKAYCNSPSLMSDVSKLLGKENVFRSDEINIPGYDPSEAVFKR